MIVLLHLAFSCLVRNSWDEVMKGGNHMTANQIAWWNIQENIRSHMQNEQNERNKNSITESLGDESNRINAMRTENEFILGQQGNQINKRRSETEARRAAQDYDIGLKTVANTAQRNANDYEIGTTANKLKAVDISNNFILGKGNLKNQATRNAQDYALGIRQQDSYSKVAGAAALTAGTRFAELNPLQMLAALGAEKAQKGANTVIDKATKKVVDTVKNTPTSSAKFTTKDLSSTGKQGKPKTKTTETKSSKPSVNKKTTSLPATKGRNK